MSPEMKAKGTHRNQRGTPQLFMMSGADTSVHKHKTTTSSPKMERETQQAHEDRACSVGMDCC